MLLLPEFCSRLTLKFYWFSSIAPDDNRPCQFVVPPLFAFINAHPNNSKNERQHGHIVTQVSNDELTNFGYPLELLDTHNLGGYLT